MDDSGWKGIVRTFVSDRIKVKVTELNDGDWSVLFQRPSQLHRNGRSLQVQLRMLS